MLSPGKVNLMAQQVLLVSGFLGALGLAALVLTLESPRSFERKIWFWSAHSNFVAIIGFLSLVVALSVFCSLSMIHVGGGAYSEESVMMRFGLYNLFGAFSALMVAMPILIAPLSPWGGQVVATVEVVMLAIYLVVVRYSDRKQRAIVPK